jgi:bis(5'-nucleosyl)-tetraphosphatase (symmetrical)
MAVYAIGDLQGCYDPFRHLLDEIRFDPERDTLWLVGDLVNRGPKSLKTLRFVKSLGDSVVTVLGNHDLHLLALAAGKVEKGTRFRTLKKTLKADDRDELVDWLRHRPLAHYNKKMNTLLVHAGVYPTWTVDKTLALAAEVEGVLQSDSYADLLGRMYGNRPRAWSDNLSGYDRLRCIINCLTRMRMLTPRGRLNFAHSAPPYKARHNLTAWFDAEDIAWDGTRVVFGHWSALGLVVMPHMICVDTGCIWGRHLTAVRIDKREARVFQVDGQH